MSDAQAVTEETFDQEVLSSDTPVLVDFWAEWCQPCHMVSPILDKIAEERQGQLKLVKINIDEQPRSPSATGSPRSRPWCSSRTASRRPPRSGAQPKGALERQLGLSENGAG